MIVSIITFSKPQALTVKADVERFFVHLKMENLLRND
jgi:hypothetical protein